MLTTWHCPHLPITAAATDQYLLRAGPTAANLQQQQVSLHNHVVQLLQKKLLCGI